MEGEWEGEWGGGSRRRAAQKLTFPIFLESSLDIITHKFGIFLEVREMK